jgi:hypothetical protein
MTSRIPFPATPENGDFHTEPNGMRWQWSSFKHRWSFKPPAAITSGYQISLTAPTDTTLLWVDPGDGSVSYYDTENEVWVVGSGAGTDGEDGQDGQDLTEVIDPVDVASPTHTFVTANLSKYLCFTYVGDKTANLPIAGSGLSPVVGNVLTVRNDSNAGDLTLTPFGDVPPVVKAFAGALVLPPNTTAQLLYRGDNVWHLL